MREDIRSPEERTVERNKLEIQSLVESVALLADTRNFESLEALYAEEVEVDYTSLVGGELEFKSPRALMTQWASVLPGFDVTKHTLSGTEIVLSGQKATVECQVRAVHLLGERSWTVSGRYRYEVAKFDEAWKIVSHKFDLLEEEGSRELLAEAAERVESCPSTYLVRQKAKEAVTRFLQSLEEKDMDKFASVWADDAVQEMPYAPPNFPSRVSGKENILKHYAAWPENAGAADFTSELLFYPMTVPEMLFAEFKGEVDILPTGRKYRQSYGGLFHVQNGQITLFREYFNPQPFSYAFALDEEPSNFSKA